MGGKTMTGGIEESGIFTAIWWVIATLTVAAALLVVFLQDLVKAAMGLIGTFLGIAGLFVMLNAEFLAVVQILVYAGAVSILLIFGIMMIRDTQRGSQANSLRIPAFALGAVLVGIITFVVLDTQWNLLGEAMLTAAVQAGVEEAFSDSPPVLGGLLLREFVLPLEAAALLLTATLVGAIALVKGE
jgi:NADH-quinone oxidoreductase subunit J